MYHGHIPGIISLQVIRDGVPQLVGTVLLRAATAVNELLCSSIKTFFSGLFVTTG